MAVGSVRCGRLVHKDGALRDYVPLQQMSTTLSAGAKAELSLREGAEAFVTQPRVASAQAALLPPGAMGLGHARSILALARLICTLSGMAGVTLALTVTPDLVARHLSPDGQLSPATVAAVDVLLDGLARRQQELELKTAELQQKLAELMQQAPVFPPSAPSMLGESRGHMGQAASQLGNKNPQMLKVFEGNPAAHAFLTEALEGLRLTVAPEEV